MLKNIAKTAAASVLHRSGALRLIDRPPLTVLGYHRVLGGRTEDVRTCPPGMVVSTEMFERHVAYAARHYRMVSLDDIEAACEGGRPLPDRACLVSFDDGWRDNYTIARPVLERMGVPAVVFVTTDFIGTRRSFWFTPMMLSLLRANGRSLARGDGQAIGWPPDLVAELDRLASLPRPLRAAQLNPLVEGLKRLPESEIEDHVAALVARLGPGASSSDPEPYFLDWDEVRSLDATGMRVASHTCGHKILTQVSEPEAEHELRASRETLQRELGRPVTSIAFPNGDYSPRHMQMASDAGYRLFFVSTRVHPGGPAGRVFPRPCVEDRVGRGPGGRFAPSLLEFHLAGAWDRLRGRW